MGASALVATLICTLVAVAPAPAADVRVATDAELASALALALPGDSIALAPGSYAPIAVTGRADITLRGDPGATIAGMTILGSSRIVVRDLAVAPAGATAYITVTSSSSITFSGLHVDGGDAGLGATIWLDADADEVVIRDSTFLNCASPMCIRASGPDVLVERNVFDELYDSDAVHGFGSGVIRGNRMDHALPHGDGNHNDFIQIGEGGPWTIEGNWFGVRTGCAASIWIDSIRKGVIHDVLVQNNVLTGHYVGQDVGIFIAGDDRSVALLPTNVRVINNTVASGLLNSLRFGAAYSTIPVEQRPLVANNVGDRLAGMCDRIRSVDNVFAVGQACSASDVIGDAALDSTGAPTAASALLLGRADPSLATPVDFFGCARTAPPDIGAIELGACPTVAAPLPAAAATTTALAAGSGAKLPARIVSVSARRLARRVVIIVRAGGALRVRVAVVAGRRIVSKASRRGNATGRFRFDLRAPRSGRLVVRVRVIGAGGEAARTITLGKT
jgi:Right handed beta helix region